VPDVSRNATAVVVDGQRDDAVGTRELDDHARGVGVARDVGQRLLGDAVDHDLGVIAERRHAEVEVAIDEHAALAGQTRGQRVERAGEPELDEQIWPQVASDAPHVVETAPRALACLLEV
jgi:hypothetical protein